VGAQDEGGGSRRWWLVAGALGAALVALTVAVGLEWSPLERLDGAVARRAFDATAGHDGRTTAWQLVSRWGGPDPMRLVLLLAGLVAAVRRRADVAVWLVALAVVEAVVAPATKQLLDRARPEWPDPISVLASTSYPSGHATAAATAVVALALAVRRTAVTCAAVVVAVAVAASRVFLGVHYLSDVTGGVLLGSWLAVTSYAVVLSCRRALSAPAVAGWRRRRPRRGGRAPLPGRRRSAPWSRDRSGRRPARPRGPGR
jgi:membrane-associated phospholipid phosphatase